MAAVYFLQPGACAPLEPDEDNSCALLVQVGFFYRRPGGGGVGNDVESGIVMFNWRGAGQQNRERQPQMEAGVQLRCCARRMGSFPSEVLRQGRLPYKTYAAFKKTPPGDNVGFS